MKNKHPIDNMEKISGLNDYPQTYQEENHLYSYIHGKILKVTICDVFYKKNEGKHYLVCTENGESRFVHEKKVFNTFEECVEYLDKNNLAPRLMASLKKSREDVWG